MVECSADHDHEHVAPHTFVLNFVFFFSFHHYHHVDFIARSSHWLLCKIFLDSNILLAIVDKNISCARHVAKWVVSIAPYKHSTFVNKIKNRHTNRKFHFVIKSIAMEWYRLAATQLIRYKQTEVRTNKRKNWMDFDRWRQNRMFALEDRRILVFGQWKRQRIRELVIWKQGIIFILVLVRLNSFNSSFCLFRSFSVTTQNALFAF